MKLIVGLGNPGSQYQNTRHNLGHNLVSNLAQVYQTSFKNQPKLSARISDRVGESSDKFYLVLTDVYMNLSGNPVSGIMNYYKIDPSDLIVVHDDLDLGVGEWRFQFDRGSAGHNGIKDIAAHLGTSAFWRLRIGIGHPRTSTNPNLPVEDYVLQSFTPEEKVIIAQTIDKITGNFENIITGH